MAPTKAQGQAQAQAFFTTGDPASDALLGRDPLALLPGMLLDQRSSRPREGRM